MKNFFRLYKIMLRYWVYMVVGLIFMFGYAALSGMTITMAIPLFDHVFATRDVPAIYTNWSEFSSVLGALATDFFAQVKNIFSFAESANFKSIGSTFFP